MVCEQPNGVKAWRQEEVGLRLPNGTELWPPQRWHGRGFATAADRQAILKAVLESEEFLSLDTQEVVKQFSWLTRHSTITVVTENPHTVVPLEETGYIEPPPPEPEPEAETASVVVEEGEWV